MDDLWDIVRRFLPILLLLLVSGAFRKRRPAPVFEESEGPPLGTPAAERRRSVVGPPAPPQTAEPDPLVPKISPPSALARAPLVVELNPIARVLEKSRVAPSKSVAGAAKASRQSPWQVRIAAHPPLARMILMREILDRPRGLDP